MVSLIQLNMFLLMKKKRIFIESYKFDCRSCGNEIFKKVVSLGYQPLANNLLKKRKERCEFYPLEVNYCNKCHNCQLSVSVNQEKCFQIIYYIINF